MYFSLALLVAAFSGCAALCHELLWTRRLIDLLGASAQSSTLVFECFFLGLALGAACSTKLVQRVQRPWRTVALIEIGIALLSMPALTLPAWTDWIWPWLGPDRLANGMAPAVKLAISVLVMIPPTFLMGMTLPLMARAVLNDKRTLGRQGVWLYGINTLGGVIGLWWTTAVLLPWLHVAGSMIFTAVLNLLVATACLWADRYSSIEPTRTGAGRASQTSFSRLSPTVLLMAFGSGAGVLAVEVLSMHLFMQVAPSAIHAVAALLGALILSLAVSALIVPWLTPRFGSASALLAPVLIFTSLATASTPLMFMWLTNNMVTIQPSSTLLGFMLKMTGYVLGSIGPSILLAGLVFPLLFVWFSREHGDPHGRRWGWLLAVNGVGGVVGAEAAQRMVMPLFGMHGGLGVIGLGYAALAVVLMFAQNGWRAVRGPVWRPVAVMGVILVLGVGWLLRLPLIHPAPTKKIKFQTIGITAGPEGVVAVTDSKEFGRGIVMFNQYMLGSTAGMAEEQRQAHLPIMLHPNAKRVAMIGVATGITAGATLKHNQVESVVAVELSQLVAHACKKHFAPYTNGLFIDPRVTVVVEDGRTFIASCIDEFDVVVGDLFLPWRPGVGRLFSLEHFQAVRRSLRTGGLFCQMLPMYQFNHEQQEVVLATFLQVFSEAHLFRLDFNADMPVLAIVGNKDGNLDWKGLEARCQRLRDDGKVLDPIMRHHEAIAMLYLGSTLTPHPTAETINTLDNAWIELAAGRDFVTGKWDEDYFMNKQKWIDLEHRLVDQSADRLTVDSNQIRFSRLGNQITQWNYVRHSQKATAHQLKKAIRGVLPKGLVADIRANKASSPDWAAVLGEW